MLDKKKKDRIIEKYKTHENDTGSPEVQIAILTAEIKELTEHLKEHKKDFSSRRGLIKKVAQRRRLLQYLQRDNSESYEDIIKKLKIKKRSPETMTESEEEKEIREEEERVAMEKAEKEENTNG
jgi:small subunit ribosomal protein S15|tara:strand:+ start:140 stop:511 length:372 start_codon:yes stop_codon:yes gene_type:complete